MEQPDVFNVHLIRSYMATTYIQVDGDIWLCYKTGSASATVISKSKLLCELAETSARIETAKEALSDDALLAWAKENYPYQTTQEELDRLSGRESDLQTTLRQLV